MLRFEDFGLLIQKNDYLFQFAWPMPNDFSVVWMIQSRMVFVTYWQWILVVISGIGLVAALGLAIKGILLRRALAACEKRLARYQTVVSRVSHDIRTPLTVFQICCDKSHREITTKTREALIASATAMSFLVEQLRYCSESVDGTELEIELIPIEVSELIERLTLISEFKYRHSRIGVTTKVSRSLPMKLYLNEPLLTEVITNLLDNAFKNTEDGEIGLAFSSIKVPCDESWESRPFIRIDDPKNAVQNQRRKFQIVVSDSGRGMSATELESALGIRPAKMNALPRTCMGLSIVQTLIAMMNGRFSLTSQPGKGTVATIQLPMITRQAPCSASTRPVDSVAGVSAER